MLYSASEPTTKRAKRLLQRREPKVRENEKRAMIVAGHAMSERVRAWLTDVYALKNPHAVKLRRKNDVLPFEDESKVEFLALKNDCSLFVVGNHTKKRPDNVVMGRLFDFKVLDLLEFGFENFKSMQEFEGAAAGVGMRPCFVFCGEDFETKPEFKKVANLFLDFFRGRTTTMINLKGLEHVIVMTAVEDVVYFRHYSISLQKSGTSLPRVELTEIGPSFDMRIRRTKFAGEDQWKQATKQHAIIAPKAKKNIERDSLGQTLGNVHVGRQDLTTLVTKKGKALRRGRDEEEGQEDEDGDDGDNLDEEEVPRGKKTGKKVESSDGSKQRKRNKPDPMDI